MRSASCTMRASSIVRTVRSRIKKRPLTMTASISAAWPLWIQPDTMRRVGTRCACCVLSTSRSAFSPLPASRERSIDARRRRRPGWSPATRPQAVAAAVIAENAFGQQSSPHDFKHILRVVIRAHSDGTARSTQRRDGGITARRAAMPAWCVTIVRALPSSAISAAST